jgi:hypothetical protein
VDPTNWVFDERVFGLVTAFSFIQNPHQLFQMFLGECNGWHWPDNTPLDGSAVLLQIPLRNRSPQNETNIGLKSLIIQVRALERRLALW